MQSSEFSRFAAILTTAAQAGYRAEASPETLRLYFDALSSYQLRDLERALAAHVRDEERGRFFPTVADLVAKVRVVVAERNEANRRLAEERRLPAPDSADADPQNWLPADPVVASMVVWRNVLEVVGARMRGESPPELLDPEVAKQALESSGAFESGLPVGWSRMVRHDAGTTPLSDWASRYARAFRQAYCHAHGCELPETAPRSRRREV